MTTFSWRPAASVRPSGTSSMESQGCRAYGWSGAGAGLGRVHPLQQQCFGMLMERPFSPAHTGEQTWACPPARRLAPEQETDARLTTMQTTVADHILDKVDRTACIEKLERGQLTLQDKIDD
ncbi:hypothetical protein NDU88_003543 [Pleurodeles waltl]|uniref:Uncharacterized protein n=1 Tax=Pleurodeles waltl TaxID=8319 RepID=A0AAV7T4Z4_PLEWA|nr:hypothetical protein NDU88_003543 [Pleurodeles waltl]